MKQEHLIDAGDYPRIEAYGLADFYTLGDGRGRIVLFDWFKIDGVFRRQVVGTVTRQLTTLREEQAEFWAAVYRDSPATAPIMCPLH